MPVLNLSTLLQRGDVTLLARTTGLAISTVSRVVNEKQVAAEIRVKVWNAAADLAESRKKALAQAEQRVAHLK